MDDIVKQAMQKWPNVPDCYGWLGRDVRGHWWLRDATAQAQGAFPQSKGWRLEHAGWMAFIERNYAVDARGCWFFQNGPQRVYVELESVPQVWRVQPDGALTTTAGVGVAPPQHCWMDEQGLLYLLCADVLGVVASADMLEAAQLLEQGRWPALQEVSAQALPSLGGFVRSPQALVQAQGMSGG